jgi:nicotinate phosphoribosyltransferase
LQRLLGTRTVQLIDTYNTLEGARRVAELGRPLWGVRLDSGDVVSLAQHVRSILDEAGLGDVKIMATGDLDEYKIRDIVRAGGPVDVFGVGTELATSADAPSMGTVYKLVEVDICGIKRFTAKFSENKETLPGAKQLFRLPDRDVLARAAECCTGSEALLRPVILGGNLVEELCSADAARARALESMAKLPAELRGLAPAEPRRVEFSKDLAALAERTRRNLA